MPAALGCGSRQSRCENQDKQQQRERREQQPRGKARRHTASALSRKRRRKSSQDDVRSCGSARFPNPVPKELWPRQYCGDGSHRRPLSLEGEVSAPFRGPRDDSTEFARPQCSSAHGRDARVLRRLVHITPPPATVVFAVPPSGKVRPSSIHRPFPSDCVRQARWNQTAQRIGPT
jgi:hypothetical protein